MATLKEWIRDWKKRTKWNKFDTKITIVALIITVVISSIYFFISQQTTTEQHEESQETSIETLEYVQYIKTMLSENETETFNMLVYEKTNLTLDQIIDVALYQRENAKSYCDRGLAELVLGNYSEALESYEKACEIDPTLSPC